MPGPLPRCAGHPAGHAHADTEPADAAVTVAKEVTDGLDGVGRWSDLVGTDQDQLCRWRCKGRLGLLRGVLGQDHLGERFPSLLVTARCQAHVVAADVLGEQPGRQREVGRGSRDGRPR